MAMISPLGKITIERELNMFKQIARRNSVVIDIKKIVHRKLHASFPLISIFPLSDPPP